MMNISLATLSVLSALLMAAGPVLAAAPPDPIVHGRSVAQAYCSGCHAIGAVGASPHRPAPAFRDLHLRYDVASLQEALAEGMSVGHPNMPEIKLWPDEIADFIAYLKSLEGAPTPPAAARPDSRK